MSTSLNVVSMAAVFCASLRRLAIVCRMRDILTRSSLRSPAFPSEGRGPGGGAFASGAGAFACGAWAGGIGGRGRGSLGGTGCSRSASHRALVDPRDHRADRDRVTLADQLLCQDAGDGRRHLDADLVGFEAGDRLVRGNRLARLLQ